MAAPGGGEPDGPQRVKVYRLNSEGTWDDRGTGFVGVEALEAGRGGGGAEPGRGPAGLVVVGEGEREGHVLLVHRITRACSYTRQGGALRRFRIARIDTLPVAHLAGARRRRSLPPARPPSLLLSLSPTPALSPTPSTSAEDTIITWSDAEAGTDVALSFEAPEGCAAVWRRLADAQAALPPGGGPGSPARRDEFGGAGPGSPYDAAGRGGLGAADAEPLELPPPELGNLAAIADALAGASVFQRDTAAAQLLAPGYLPALAGLLSTAEDLEDAEALAALHRLFKAAVLLADAPLLEALFSEEMVWPLVGALERDPEAPPGAEAPRHREWLARRAALKEVVPIADAAVRAKIQASYRMGYVKDAVIARALDDAAFATLSSLQLFAAVEAAAALAADPAFLPELLARMRAAEPGSEAWRDLVAFTQELTALARHLQPAARRALLGRLAELGLYEALAGVFASGDGAAAARAAEVLLADALHDPGRLRAHLCAPAGAPLLRALVSALLEEGGGGGVPPPARPAGGPAPAPPPLPAPTLVPAPPAARRAAPAPPTPGAPPGLAEQALEVLRALLDPDGLDGPPERDPFAETFYEAHLGRLVAALTDGARASPATVCLVLDLLSFLAVQHGYRIKYYALRNGVLEKAARLLGRRERAVAAAALRFLRVCLALRDDFFARAVAKGRLLEPLLAAFLANGPRYNLLNSAALELFDFLRRENLRGLVAAVAESPLFPRLLEEAPYTDAFRLLRARYEANLEAMPGGAGAGAGAAGGLATAGAAANARAAAAAEARLRRGEREEDADEESYFSREDDGDGEPGGAAPGAARSPPRVTLSPAGAPGSGGGGGDDDDDDETLRIGPFAPGGGAPGRPPLARLVDYEYDEEDTIPLRAPLRAPPRAGGAGLGGGGLSLGVLGPPKRAAAPAGAGEAGGAGGSPPREAKRPRLSDGDGDAPGP
jgi:protein phosphatase-4 regulatory subunit 3